MKPDLYLGVGLSVAVHAVGFWACPEQEIPMFDIQRGVAAVEVHFVQAVKPSTEDILPEERELIVEATAPEAVDADSSQTVEPGVDEEVFVPKEIVPDHRLEPSLQPEQVLAKTEAQPNLVSPQVSEVSTSHLKHRPDILAIDGKGQESVLVNDPQTSMSQKEERDQAKDRQEAPQVKPVGAEYPLVNGRIGQERAAWLNVQVDRYGIVQHFEMVNVNGVDDLDQVQIQHLKDWRFNPEAMNHIPRHAWVGRVMDQLKALGVEKVYFEMNEPKEPLVSQKIIEENAHIYAMADVDEPAEPLSRQNAAPRYPGAARRKGYQGVVDLKLHINPDGDVEEISLIHSSGYDLLDQEALAAVEIWSFRSARLNGVNVASWVEIPIRFQLDQD